MTDPVRPGNDGRIGVAHDRHEVAVLFSGDDMPPIAMDCADALLLAALLVEHALACCPNLKPELSIGGKLWRPSTK
jgi:hypothetical protein